MAEALARVGFHTNVLCADMSQEMGLERSERVGTLDCTVAQLRDISLALGPLQYTGDADTTSCEGLVQ